MVHKCYVFFSYFKILKCSCHNDNRQYSIVIMVRKDISQNVKYKYKKCKNFF